MSADETAVETAVLKAETMAAEKAGERVVKMAEKMVDWKVGSWGQKTAVPLEPMTAKLGRPMDVRWAFSKVD